jgi:hypothetical protein|tara:strand:+ start:247 stop:480 length:234 start_codon:yes stop_codon:yes gene_type:complete
MKDLIKHCKNLVLVSLSRLTRRLWLFLPARADCAGGCLLWFIEMRQVGLTWAENINDLDVSADAKPLGACLVVGLPV